LLALRLPPRAQRAATTFLVDLRDGWDAFRSRRWLWTFVACAAFGNLLYGVWRVFGPVIAEEDFGGAAVWGAILGAFGVGSILGGVIALRTRPRRPMMVCVATGVLFGVPLAALPRALLRSSSAPARYSPALASCLATRFGKPPSSDTGQARPSRVSAYDWFGSLALEPIGLAIWGPIATSSGSKPPYGRHSASSLQARWRSSLYATSGGCPPLRHQT
jgi:predicted MFS family arabinose efflux permease